MSRPMIHELNPALRPCPFCGGQAIDKLSNGWGWIECRACGAKGPAERIGHGGDPDRAWNARADDPDPGRPVPSHGSGP